MVQLCKALKKRSEILACEYLDKKKMFGDKASIDEMSSFKSKVKKQEVVYDPEEEKEKEKKRKEEEIERKRIENEEAEKKK